jgi:hypothetical protein
VCTVLATGPKLPATGTCGASWGGPLFTNSNGEGTILTCTGGVSDDALPYTVHPHGFGEREGYRKLTLPSARSPGTTGTVQCARIASKRLHLRSLKS